MQAALQVSTTQPFDKMSVHTKFTRGISGPVFARFGSGSLIMH